MTLGPTGYTVASALAKDLGPDGDLLIDVKTDKPRSLHALVAHDGTRLVPLVVEGEPLPGTSIVPTDIKENEARLVPGGGVFVRLTVTGAPYE